MKIGNRGEIEVLLGGILGIAISIYCSRGCDRNLAEVKAKQEACHNRCKPHPVRLSDPCTCIMNEEYR